MRLLIFLLFLAPSVFGQSMSSGAVVQTLYSENGQFYLKSLPHDNNDYTIIGTTYVYKVGQEEPLYSLDRSFNYFGEPNKTHLSNDGQAILYINDVFGNDGVDELKVITVYTRGELIKHYSVSDLSDCDNDYQDCFLLYRNKEVINRDSSKWHGDHFIPGIKEGTSAVERFANIYNVFSSRDTVYLVDQFRHLIRFDLATGVMINSSDLKTEYPKVKELVRTNKIEIEYYDLPQEYGIGLPSLTNGQSFRDALSGHLNMVAMKFYGKEFNNYKGYLMDFEVIIDIKGEIQIKNIELESGLPEEEIRAFIYNHTWDMNKLPSALEKWYFKERLLFRKSSKSVAKKEKEVERAKYIEAYQKRIKLDSLDGFYIPKNLYECMVQLDSLLKPKHREAIKSSGGNTSLYHHGLGRYLRNNWGLWSGSRLQKYFENRAPFVPDDMSVIILDYYYEWLNGRTNAWKEWEKEYPVIKK